MSTATTVQRTTTATMTTNGVSRPIDVSYEAIEYSYEPGEVVTVTRDNLEAFLDRAVGIIVEDVGELHPAWREIRITANEAGELSSVEVGEAA